jgi:hypothetical protein
MLIVVWFPSSSVKSFFFKCFFESPEVFVLGFRLLQEQQQQQQQQQQQRQKQSSVGLSVFQFVLSLK